MTRLTLFLLALSLPARAQTGTCSGGGLAGVVGLALPVDKSGYQSLAASEIAHAFSAADCECNSSDIALDIFLTQALPQGAVGTAEVWVGAGCDTNTVARTTVNQTVCEKIVTTIAFSQF